MLLSSCWIQGRWVGGVVVGGTTFDEILGLVQVVYGTCDVATVVTIGIHFAEELEAMIRGFFRGKNLHLPFTSPVQRIPQNSE